MKRARFVSRGYVYVGVGTRYQAEHRVAVERALGKPLRSTAEVHHVDGDKANNIPGNLVACDSVGYHLVLHRRQRALEACGDANAARCGYCGKYDKQDEMYRYVRRGTVFGDHRSCRSDYYKSRRCPKTPTEVLP